MSENVSNEADLVKEIDAEIKADNKEKKMNKRYANKHITALILLLGGALGWIASLEILMGKLFLLENPGATLACDANPLVSCGTIMMTWQASALGIPNMAVGLAGFAIMGVIGALMLSGATLPKWMKWATLGGMLFAFGMVHFLSVSAIFFIGALCPWCMVVWATVAPMFFVTLANRIEDAEWHKKNIVASLLRHWVIATILWYLLVAVTIFVVFYNQWMIILGF